MSRREHYLVEQLHALLERLLKPGRRGKLVIIIEDGLPIRGEFNIGFKMDNLTNLMNSLK